MEEDLYQSIADRCTDLPKKHSRAIVKLEMGLVDWFLWKIGWRCKDNVSKWRMDHADEITYLDAMSWNDLSDMVDYILAVLHDEFKASGEFRSALSRAVARAEERTDRKPTDGIEWTTASNFVVHQATFKTSKKTDLVANGFEGDVQIIAKMPNDKMNWKKMETKTPPNLVHSQDATVVHELLAGASSSNQTPREKWKPLSTVRW
jgi:hypothetical protein